MTEYNTIKLIFNMGEVHISSDNPIVGKAEETVPLIVSEGATIDESASTVGEQSLTFRVTLPTNGYAQLNKKITSFN